MDEIDSILEDEPEGDNQVPVEYELARLALEEEVPFDVPRD